MSITLPLTLLDRIRDLSPGEIKAYLCLSWLKTTMKHRHPSQQVIARQMNASQKSVVAYLAELERAGYIEKKRIGSGRKLDYVLLTELPYGD